jgi:ABC-2 type transport system ATP-binding protein
VATRSKLLEVVKHKAKAGAAVVYTTRYLNEIEGLGASVAILEGGRIIVRGSLAELLSAHGETVVEVSFRAPPERFPTGAVVVDDRCCRLPSADPSMLIDEIHKSGAGNLRSINVVRPSLESIYLSLTGRRFSAGAEDIALESGAGAEQG